MAWTMSAGVLLAQAAPAAPPAPTGLPADQVAAFVFLGVVLIIAAARLCGAVAVKLHQPRVVGEIIAGVLLGPSLLGPTLLVWNNAPDVLACDRALAPSNGVAIGGRAAAYFPRGCAPRCAGVAAEAPIPVPRGCTRACAPVQL